MLHTSRIENPYLFIDILQQKVIDILDDLFFLDDALHDSSESFLYTFVVKLFYLLLHETNVRVSEQA